MAFSLNEVKIIGNLGKDPEIRNLQSGKSCANLVVACSESWRDKQTGERKEKTEWVRVVIWNEKLVEIAEQYLRKGQQVYISGKLETRKWTDQQGVERYSTEVVLQGFDSKMGMLGKRDGGGARPADDDDGFDTAPAQNRNARSGGYASSRQRQAPANDMDDDIPF